MVWICFKNEQRDNSKESSEHESKRGILKGEEYKDGNSGLGKM
jgi:hypothetical protein